MSDLNEQLLPCAHCGHNGSAELDPNAVAPYGHTVLCDACCASVGSYPSEAAAIAAWNRRAPAAAPAPVAASIAGQQEFERLLMAHAAEFFTATMAHDAPRVGQASTSALDEAGAKLVAYIDQWGAALAAVPAAAPVVQSAAVVQPVDLDEGAAIRLRLICELLGLSKAVPENPRELWAVAFSVLGMVRHEVENLKRTAPTPASSTADAKDATQLLDAEELAALRRFNETCEDDEEYDVPKEMMRRLAAVGAIQWKGFSRYQITGFGDFVLDRAAIASSAGEVKP